MFRDILHIFAYLLLVLYGAVGLAGCAEKGHKVYTQLVEGKDVEVDSVMEVVQHALMYGICGLAYFLLLTLLITESRKSGDPQVGKSDTDEPPTISPPTGGTQVGPAKAVEAKDRSPPAT